MRSFVCVVLLGWGGSLAVGAEPKPRAQLSKEESAAGWVQLFDGASLFGWQAAKTPSWQVQSGKLVPLVGQKGPLVTTSLFGPCEVHIRYRGKKEGTVTLLLGADAQGTVGKVTKTFTLEADTPADTFLETKLLFEAGSPKGYLALTKAENIEVGSLFLKPTQTESLFNGKDLTGWQIFPDRKSEFQVTPEGWLHVKNGPGDLQTKRGWKDFFLHLECRTNGPALNSGVFFRCRPNEYQQGYEAQIHNAFDAEPTKEYTLETFDPETGAVKNTQKVKYTAKDFGTGAIYRRQPARAQNSKDNEWFTLTVLAEGRHFAVWVDGLQVTDWHDTRPVKDNARQGAKLEAGPISLQGHDPTTDLSFRNIRIVDWK